MFFVDEIFDFSHISTYDSDPSSIRSEFKSIRLQVEKHLLDPLQITTNHKCILVIFTIETFLKTLPACQDFDPQELSFFLLDTLHFPDGFQDAKAANILPKLTRLQLRKIKDIVDQEGQTESWN